MALIMITTLYQKVEIAVSMVAWQLRTQTSIPFPKFEKKSSFHFHPLDPEILILFRIFTGTFTLVLLMVAVNTFLSTMRQRRLRKLLSQNVTSQRKLRTKRRKQRKNAQKIQKKRQK